MGIKILWYLTAPDGPFPWEPEGRWRTDFRHLQQLAQTIDRLGYYGALLGTGLTDDVLTVSSAMIGATQRMRFLAAIHPGLLSPVKLAQIALTQDRLSGGRMLYNVVNGNDLILPTFGVNYEHDERYDFSFEYWDAFRRFYTGQRDGYDGHYIKLAPAPAEYGLGAARVNHSCSPSSPAACRCGARAHRRRASPIRYGCSTPISALPTRRPSWARNSAMWVQKPRRSAASWTMARGFR
jgi:alkanesulfonate monooxygenase